MEELRREQVTGGELLVCMLLELVIVRIAYSIDRSKQAPLLSTAAWAIILGILLGFILISLSKDRARDVGMDPAILFFGLVPPIVMEAGFTTQHRGFFANFWDIFLLGVVGTVLSSIGVGTALYWLGQTPLLDSVALSATEAMQYGALISSIDPIATQLVLRKSHVPSLLPELIFGERSLNNAITIAIFNLCASHVLGGETQITFVNSIMLLGELVATGAGSLILTVIVGFSSAFLLRVSDDALKQHPPYEISILLLSAYSSYLAAEFCHLSGDVAIFFSGAFIRHYHMHNVSTTSATTFRYLLRTVAFLAENFIFIYLGVSLFAYSDSFQWEWRFIVTSLVVCLVVRALIVTPLCYIANLWRIHAIPFKYMIVIWFSGLRGAVAFALALNVSSTTASKDHAAIIRSATLFSVLSTTIPFTMLMRPLNLGDRTPLLSSSLEEEGTWIRDAWNEFDHHHLQPYFGHGGAARQ
ncbi:hypothetical protein Poli38472_003554 [Pythium oligandrum]|uniref:Sodium/hydrogen exchanger n=1 Tax=Pythium oligandrum TaxID=41045 RepID=A0A8K1FE62_PYTOL|nr:hypothetical protein Poli38472_003554 [Pythium oligandrum]|eukprot:TMW57629.1 hypothetical protein Poli38472_003554 [Pythium oligandrum]